MIAGGVLVLALCCAMRFGAWLLLKKAPDAAGAPDWCGPAGEVGPPRFNP